MLCAGMIAAAPLAAAAPAGAAPPTNVLAKARAQFQQGLALETAGDWGGALTLFQEVASVKITPQVRFHIGLCEENLGKLVAALGDYRLAAAEADDVNAGEVKAQVVARIDALRDRIPKVVIKRGVGGEYATISLDGVALGATSIGQELMVDPGPHTVEGRAPGFNLFMGSFNIAERETKAVDVTLPRKTAPAVDGSQARAPGANASYGEGESGSPEAPGKHGKSVLPYVIGGVGAASLVASAVFFVLRNGAVSDLDEACGPNRDRCPPDAQSINDRGKTYTTLFWVTGWTGLVGVGTGAVLLLYNKPPASAAATRLQVALEPGRGFHGATLRATF